MLAGSRFRGDERARAADQARRNLRELPASPGGVCRATSSAISRSSPRSRSARPFTTPSRSCGIRFWLIFHLPSRRVMAKRKPTIPRSIASMKLAGASDGAHGCGWSRSCWAVSSVTWRRSQSASLTTSGRPIGVDRGKVPGRYHLAALRLGRIPIGRDVAFGALEDHQRLAAAGKVAAMRIGAREVAFDDAVASVVLEDRRQMAGKQARRTRGHERRKRPRPISACICGTQLSAMVGPSQHARLARCLLA
jgi:hypothetical protein